MPRVNTADDDATSDEDSDQDDIWEDFGILSTIDSNVAIISGDGWEAALPLVSFASGCGTTLFISSARVLQRLRC